MNNNPLPTGASTDNTEVANLKEALRVAVEALSDLIERHNYTGEDEWHIKALAEISKLRGDK